MRAKNLFTLATVIFVSLYGAYSWGESEATTPASPQQDSAAPAMKEPAPPPSVTIIGASEARGVLGRDVRGPAEEDMGRIVDVIVDRQGTVRAAVIDFGGFLGVGSRKIAIDWTALRFEPKGSSSIIRFDLAREQLRVAPEVRPGEPVVIIGAARPTNPSANVK